MTSKHISKVVDTSYFCIQGWMLTKLNLKGNELFVYAIIHGFSQDGESNFHGGLQYLADWCNSTKRGIQKNLDSLVTKGYIKKNEIYNGGEKYCTYESIPLENISIEQSSIGIEQSSMGIEQSSTNNIVNNIDNKNTIISKDIIVADKSAYDDSLEIIPKDNSFSNKRDNTLATDKKRKISQLINTQDIEACHIVTKEKPKKKDRWTMFMDDVDRFTDDEKLKELLKEYADIRLNRLAKRDGDNYDIRCWRGALKTLRNLSDDVDMRCKIVQQSIDLEYRIFCPFNEKSYSRQMWNKNKPNQGLQMTKADAKSFNSKEEKDKFEEDLKRRYEESGRRAVF